MNLEVFFERMDQDSERMILNNKTDIEVVKTKVTHIEKWFYLFITEFHLGLIGWIILKIHESGA
jgi:hypothetical protein